MKANLFMELTLLARAFRECSNYCSTLKLKTTPFNSPRSNGVLWTKGKTPSSPFFYPHARVFWFIWQLFFSLKFFKYYYCLNWDFRRYAFSPQQLLNKKQKNGLVKMGRGIILPFSKTQPVFCFLCAAGLRRLPCPKDSLRVGKDGLLFLLAFKRKKVQRMRSMCF